MNCKKCGCEVTDKKIKKCPQCGARVNGIPAWAVALIVIAVIFTAIPFFLAIVGVVAAMTLPTLISNTDMAKNRTIFKKSLSTLNQAVLMSNALNDGKEYTQFDDVWNNAKKQLMNPVDLPNGVKFADGTEVLYNVLNPVCSSSPEDAAAIGEATACAVLTIDVNGFNNGEDKRSTGTNSQGVHDQFEVYLYQNVVSVKPGTPEYDLVYGKN